LARAPVSTTPSTTSSKRADIGDLGRAGKHQRQRARDVGHRAKIALSDHLRRETIFDAIGVSDHTDHRPPHRLLSNLTSHMTSGADHARRPTPDQHATPAQRQCYFRVKTCFGSIALAARQSRRLERLARGIIGAIQPRQFRLDPARHRLAEHAAEIERPELRSAPPRRKCHAGEILSRARLPDHPGARARPGIGRVGERHETGINAPVTGTAPVIRLISLNDALPAGRVIGAQRHIIHSVEFERIVDMRQQRDKILPPPRSTNTASPLVRVCRRGCSCGRDEPPARRTPI
jgi:hypothetical protein